MLLQAGVQAGPGGELRVLQLCRAVLAGWVPGGPQILLAEQLQPGRPALPLPLPPLLRLAGQDGPGRLGGGRELPHFREYQR